MNRYFASFILIIISACSHNEYYKLSKDDKGHVHYKGSYKIGSPYIQNGVTYTPQSNESYHEVGIASWYGRKDKFHGKKTANGDKFNSKMLTAAHKTLPMPSIVRVTNLENNKKLLLMINDRGPFVAGRIIDVSEHSAKLLGFKHKGIAKVSVEYMEDETEKLLEKLCLNKKHGARCKKKVEDPKCTVNCYLKQRNIHKKYHKF
jgi:rare lipoprotein A